MLPLVKNVFALFLKPIRAYPVVFLRKGATGSTVSAEKKKS